MSGCLLADQQRLGKSIEICGLINACCDLNRVIVICPATLKIQWKNTLDKWLTVPLAVNIIWPHTTELPKSGVTIVNFDLLHRWVWPCVDMLVIDEAHLIKSPTARRTKKALAIRAAHKVFLTGTPILNRPIELYPLIKALDPKSWPTLGSFGIRYCAGFVGERGWDFSGSSNLEELYDRLRGTTMVRRLRQDVWADLPLVRREIIELPTDKSTVKREDGFRAHLRETEDLATAQRVAFERQSIVRHETALAKVPQVVDFVKDALDANDEKIILFAHHKDVIAQLADALKDFCPVLITGDTPVDTRMAAENVFRIDPACRLFIGNMVAAGVGLDLSVSSRVIFAEIDWSPGIVKQCEDRCQNPAKRDSVLVQHLVLEGSIDASMAKALVRKQDILDRVLDGKEDDKPLDFLEIFGVK
jgi:SWI/SNF-related matrix-associated actin-dependent regulator 1 of chromatin subfamily A